MKEFRVVWIACPHVQHSTRVLFVQAESPELAKIIARDHIERKFGIEWLTIQSVQETVPMPAGKVSE